MADTSTILSASDTADLGGAVIGWKPPFELQNGSKMSWVYPCVDGQDVDFRFGEFAAPVRASIFSGKDFDTGEAKPNERTVMVQLEGNSLASMRALDAAALAAAKADKATWFPAQPDISDTDIERIYKAAVHEHEQYGCDLRCKVQLDAFDKHGQPRLSAMAVDASGDTTPYDVPGSADGGAPTRINCIAVVGFHVWITLKPNGKKVDKFGIKPTLKGMLHCSDDGAGAAAEDFGQELPSLSDELGDAALGDMRAGDNGFMFGSVTVGGAAHFALPEIASTTVKLWPPFGARGGVAQTAEMEVSGDVEAGLVAIEAQVLAQLRARYAELGAHSGEAVDDCFVSLIKKNGTYPCSVRFKIDKAALLAADLRATSDTERDDALTVKDGEAPRRLQATPLRGRFYVYAKKDHSGALENVGLKFAPGALRMGDTGGGAASMFNLPSAKRPLDDVVEGMEGGDAKRVQLSAR